MSADIFTKKEQHFVLWLVTASQPAPQLIIGTLELGAPVAFINEQQFTLQQHPDFPDLWQIPAAACNLTDGQVYHYWFEVTDAHPQRTGERIRITDPFAYMVDWRLLAAKPPGPYSDDDCYPAAVIKYNQGKLIACDAGGETFELPTDAALTALSKNNQIVLYELPTAWTALGRAGEREMGVGTFRDVLALVDPGEEGGNFGDLEVTRAGRSYLSELGVNAIELLPPADSFYNRQWGYGTTNFFAPDYELGYAHDYSWPTPNRDLRALITACHAKRIRFFVDVVMAFARSNAYLAAATDAFFILHPRDNPSDPDAHNSRGKDEHNFRNGFGSNLFRYAAFQQSYDPVTGLRQQLSPGQQLMKASVLHWINNFHIDGIRMDSVENVYNWDFIREYKDLARAAWQQRYRNEPISEADERFLVVGEELQEPLELLHQGRLDGLWHEKFKKYIRAAILGRKAEEEPNFESTVRKAIDCRNFGYQDGAQAVIYLTSHDVEGFGNERLFDYLQNKGVADAEKRIKLAFTCLLTAVGIPMILAGEEFADQHDLFDPHGHVTQDGGKQVDPVNFSRLNDAWRAKIKNYVAQLIKFRTSSNALSVNDTHFIHVDLNDGKQVLVWCRGQLHSENKVVVVANFSDYGTPNPESPFAEYVIPDWPATPPSKKWQEITQNREVPAEWIGREPIFPWEAKVYTLV